MHFCFSSMSAHESIFFQAIPVYKEHCLPPFWEKIVCLKSTTSFLFSALSFFPMNVEYYYLIDCSHLMLGKCSGFIVGIVVESIKRNLVGALICHWGIVSADVSAGEMFNLIGVKMYLVGHSYLGSGKSCPQIHTISTADWLFAH